jgi:hypothetical protein
MKKKIRVISKIIINDMKIQNFIDRNITLFKFFF